MSSRKSHNARTAARTQSEIRSLVLCQNQEIQRRREELDRDPDYKRAVHRLRTAEMNLRKKFEELQEAHNKLVQEALFSNLSDLVAPLIPLEQYETFYFDDVHLDVIREFNIRNHKTGSPVARLSVDREVESHELAGRSNLENTTDNSNTQRSASESSPLTSTPPPPHRALPNNKRKASVNNQESSSKKRHMEVENVEGREELVKQETN